MALTALKIKSNKPGVFADGNGLYLQTTTAGAKSWIFRYSINNRRRSMGLGSISDKTIAAARADIPALRAQVVAGLDPIEERDRAAIEVKVKLEVAKLESTTFKEAALAFIEKKKPEWSNDKHVWQWTNSLEKFVFPVFGSVPVGDVSTHHVLDALNAIWLTKNETATRVRQRIEQILDFAKFNKWRAGENVATWAGHLEHTLAKPSRVSVVEHQPALPYKKIAEFLTDLRQRKGMGARALEFLILTAARSGEVRGARWDEIDLTSGIWTVPPSRMKGEKGKRKEHRVPLSDRAIELLKALPRMAVGPLVFFGRDGDTPLSDMTIKASIGRINADRIDANLPPWVDEKSGRSVVPHGFRSSFRDWAGEITHYPNEMAELALAHAVGDKVEAAYRRGDMFEKRRQMMNDWAIWCEIKDAQRIHSIFANAA